MLKKHVDLMKTMTFKTSHAGLLALGAQVLATMISPICGHTIDPSTLDVSMGFTMVITTIDWIKRHYSTTSSTGPQSLV